MLACFTFFSVPQLPGCTPHGRPLFHSPRVVVGVLFLVVWVAAAAVVVGVSPAVLASYGGLTTPRQQKLHLPPAVPSISSRVPTLPITRTVPLSAHILLMPIMDMSKWHPRYLSSPFLFRWVNIQYVWMCVCVCVYSCDCWWCYGFLAHIFLHKCFVFHYVHFRETYSIFILSHFCLN